MHAIRHQARTSAWYTKEGEPRVYNPFGKVRSRNSQVSRSDLEAGRNGERARFQSDPGFSPTAEMAGGNGSLDAPPPARASTMPDMAGGDDAGQPRAATPTPQSTDYSKSTVATADSKPRRRWREKLHLGDSSTEKLNSGESEKGTNKPRYTVGNQIKNTLFNSWINVLLIASPIGIAMYYAGVNLVACFVVNFVAIVPLAALLSYATEEIALRTGETIGGLLNASFGNATELIVAIIALTKNEILIVQTSLIGSMLSNLLLVMGMCFFFGGMNREQQFFNMTVAQTAASLLAVAVGSLLIPTAFHGFSEAGDTGIDPLSRGTAVILLFVYGCYLYFQLKTHAHIFNEPSQKVAKNNKAIEEGAVKKLFAQAGAQAQIAGGGRDVDVQHEEEDEEDVPNLHIIVAVALLAVATALIAVNSECLVDSIPSITGSVSPTFVGLILLPIVGNAAEHATAVTVSVKDKMDLAIGVAVGSSMQIALLVVPLSVIIGWGMGNSMSLLFDGFEIAILFIAVLIVNYLIADEKSNWLEGVLLMSTYLLIAVAAWFYPKNLNAEST